jgi:hypothetical protein
LIVCALLDDEGAANGRAWSGSECKPDFRLFVGVYTSSYSSSSRLRFVGVRVNDCIVGRDGHGTLDIDIMELRQRMM